MLSYAGRLIEYFNSIQNLRQCVLTCTLTQTQSKPRTILGKNLAKNGWRKIHFSQQTLWVARKRLDEFMRRDSFGRLTFNLYKIKKTFSSYFAGVGANYRVEADFVLFIGDEGKCTIKYTKSSYSPAQIHCRPF